MSDFTDVIQVDVDVDINLYPSPILECNSWAVNSSVDR